VKIFSGSSARCTLYTCFVFIFWVEGVWGFRIRGCFEFKGLWGKGYGDAGVIEVCPGDWCLVCLPSLSLSCLVLCGWGDLAAAALAHDGDLLVEGVHHRDRPLRHALPIQCVCESVCARESERESARERKKERVSATAIVPLGTLCQSRGSRLRSANECQYTPRNCKSQFDPDQRAAPEKTVCHLEPSKVY